MTGLLDLLRELAGGEPLVAPATRSHQTVAERLHRRVAELVTKSNDTELAAERLLADLRRGSRGTTHTNAEEHDD